tara:strand:+ start:1420 stop:2109 length:690 start_codon:yes stop_codon:yes gene_type:complete
MALPKIETPKYKLNIPSTGHEIEYRPFLVKEEKLLLIAQESNNTADIITAMKTIIENCTFGAIKVDELTTYDFEYIFLQLRIKSIGETSDVRMLCSECEEYSEVTIDLNEVKIAQPEEKPKSLVMLTDTVGIKLKPISVKYIDKIDEDDMTAVFRSVIESIFDEEKIYDVSDHSDKELDEFIDSISHSALEEVNNFIDNQPKLTYEGEFKGQTGHVNKFLLEGFQSFFA